MTRLLPLIALVTLVGCENVKRSTITKEQAPETQKYEQALAVKRGTVAIIDKAGTDFALDFSQAKLLTTPVSERQVSVVIHVDGDEVYNYIETKNNITGETSRKVIMTTIDAAKDLQELIASGKGSISGDMLIMTGSMKSKSEESNFFFETKTDYRATVDLNQAHCSSTNNVTTEGTVKINSEVSTAVANMRETSVCEKSYNNRKLRMIDLKSIEFCMETEDKDGYVDQECKDDQDLSYLTEDL